MIWILSIKTLLLWTETFYEATSSLLICQDFASLKSLCKDKSIKWIRWYGRRWSVLILSNNTSSKNKMKNNLWWRGFLHTSSEFVPDHHNKIMFWIRSVWSTTPNSSPCKTDDWFSWTDLSWVVQSNPILNWFGNERCCNFYRQPARNVITCFSFHILADNVCIWWGF